MSDTTDSSSDDYTAFLKSKVRLAESWGFEDVRESEVNPVLKPHQRAAVLWNVRGGRRGDFLSFGLGKTPIQLETLRIILTRVRGRGLIVCPLGVKQEFIRDAVKLLGWAEPPRFIRSIEEADDTGIYLTNYETVRDGKLDPAEFIVVSLDEAAILRGFGGSKTFRELMVKCLMTVPYRAILKGRIGVGFELNPAYFLDGAVYCRAAENEVLMPSLFDLDKIAAEAPAASEPAAVSA
jgi:hypothetical protein